MEEGPDSNSSSDEQYRKNTRSMSLNSSNSGRVPPLLFSQSADQMVKPQHSSRSFHSARNSSRLNFSALSIKSPRVTFVNPKVFIAEQSRQAQRLFQKVHRDDFFKEDFHGAKDEMITHWNILSQKVLTDFTQSESISHQQKSLDFYCDCLREALKNHNYHSASAIYFALESVEIRRMLKKRFSLSMQGTCETDINKTGALSFRKNDKSLFLHVLTLFNMKDKFEAYITHMSVLEHAMALKSKQKHTSSFSSFYNDFHKNLVPLLTVDAPDFCIPWVAPYCQKADLIAQIGTKEKVDLLRKEESIIRFMMSLSSFKKKVPSVYTLEPKHHVPHDMKPIDDESELAIQISSSEDDEASTLSVELAMLKLEKQDESFASSIAEEDPPPRRPHTPPLQVRSGLNPKKNRHKKKHLE